jgi:peptidoglycan-associated lipoprotein
MTMMRLRMTGLATMAVTTLSALVLAGCGSTVKLDEAPVESRTPTPVGAAGSNSASANALSGSGVGSGNASAQSQVSTATLPGASAGGLGRVVYFDFDSYVVKDEFRSLIDAHAKVLAAQRGKRVVIEGHTDDSGGREYNLALGQKRAEAVAKSLVLLGVQESQVEAVSFGMERPASSGTDDASRARNRRAELKDR